VPQPIEGQQQQLEPPISGQLIDFDFSNENTAAETPNFTTSLNMENNNVNNNLSNLNIIDSVDFINVNNNNITMLVASDSQENRGGFI
jgi:hypothetical protein